MARTLKPQDQIAHYRIAGPLGAGGMGEVYRAQDQKLRRDVALKILPPALVQSEERVRRFELEARSASSLNHPHIVTIYEIGHDQVRSGDGSPEPDSSPLHYISMELVSGKTLSAKIHQEKTDLKTLLGWLAQAAEGLAKAHAAGIVHRDLKPGNIMVSSDGYAKVLDFGLAKLTERQASGADLTAAPTLTVEQTSEGVVLGTVGYMAPEQVQGKAVDPRADIFSFGAMLYEAATRHQPFAAPSNVETLHRILHDVPAPIETLNPEVPAELRRLIRRCLAKDPNQRLDSMRTVALELREIVEEYDSLSASTSSGSTITGRTRRRRVPIPAVLIVMIAILGAVGYWLLNRGPAPLNPNMRTRPVEVPMHTVRYPGFSPDGKWIALPARDENNQWGLFYMNVKGGEVRRVASGPDLQLYYADISPEGSEIAYDALTKSVIAEVRVVSVLGGRPRTIASPGHGPRWSPDGQRIGYLVWGRESRSRFPEFWIVRSDGSEPTRAFVDSTSAIQLRSCFAWSPDGRRVAWLRSFDRSAYNEIVVRDLANGHERQLTHDRKTIDEVTWTPRGEILFSSNRGGATNIWAMHARGGDPIQVTRGAGPDLGIRASADGRSLLYLVSERLARAGWWDVVTGEEGWMTKEDRPIAFLNPSPDGRRVAMRVITPDAMNFGPIVVMNRDGTERRTVVRGEDDPRTYDWSPDGRSIAWARGRGVNSDTAEIHRVDVSTGAALPPILVPTRGVAVLGVRWVSADTILIRDRQSSFPFSLTQGTAGDRSPDGTTRLKLSVPGWIALSRPPGVSEAPGIYLGSVAGGVERLVLKLSWVCAQDSRSSFIYCWPESLGFSRLDLPSGRLSRPAHVPNTIRRDMTFFPSRDGRIVFWFEERDNSRIVLAENARK